MALYRLYTLLRVVVVVVVAVTVMVSAAVAFDSYFRFDDFRSDERIDAVDNLVIVESGKRRGIVAGARGSVGGSAVA